MTSFQTFLFYLVLVSISAWLWLVAFRLGQLVVLFGGTL